MVTEFPTVSLNSSAQPELLCVLPTSDLKDGCLALDAVEYARIVHGYVLLSNRLDDLLRHDAARQRCNVVQLCAACPGTVVSVSDLHHNR
jgi:hypothetical protein